MFTALPPFSCKLNKILLKSFFDLFSSFALKIAIFSRFLYEKIKHKFRREQFLEFVQILCFLQKWLPSKYLILLFAIFGLSKFRQKWPKMRYTDFRVDPNVHWIDLKSGQVVCSFPLVNNLVTYQNKFRRSLKRLIWNIFEKIQEIRKFHK